MERLQHFFFTHFSNLSAAVQILADLALPELTNATAYPRTSVALVLNW
jgi:hypothetical protein